MLALDGPERPIRSPDESPIFVIGTGRSGTTLLRQMLNAHPRIHLTHEAAFYSYARHAPAGCAPREWLERYFDTYSFAWLRLDPEEIRRALPADLSWDRVALVYQAIMRARARRVGKARYGEKNPLDTHNLPAIFRDFPDARVVYIMRDPRPTVMSFGRVPFGTPSTLLNAFLCRAQQQHIEPFLDRILEVRLEDLSADPRRVLHAVLRYLGEPWDDAVLDHVRNAESEDVPPLPWFVGATREATSRQTSDGGWRERLSPAWIRLIERINRVALRRYGYEPAALPQEPSLLALAGAVAADVPRVAEATRRLLRLKGQLDRHFRGQERLDAQAGMAANIDLNPAAWKHYPAFQMPQVPRLPAR